jgi:L-fuconolactonase
MTDPRATERTLNSYAREPKIRGLRHMFLWDPDPDWLVRSKVVESLRLAAARGYTWDSPATTPRHLENVCIVAERIPELAHVIDHMGKPPVIEGGWEPWASLMKRAASYPSVHVKLSAPLKVATVTRVPDEQLRRYVDHVLEHFGPERVMIASNWPVSNVFADYGATWRQMTGLVAGLDASQRAAVMGGTATRFYKLDLDAATADDSGLFAAGRNTR